MSTIISEEGLNTCKMPPDDESAPSRVQSDPDQLNQATGSIRATDGSAAPTAAPDGPRQPALLVNPDGSQMYVLLTDEAALQAQARLEHEAQAAADQAAAKASTYWVLQLLLCAEDDFALQE